MKKTGVDFSDLQKLSKNLDNLAQDIEKNEIEIHELFNKVFMQNHTSFASIEDYLEAGNFPIDLENISQSDLDNYVSETTSFSNWQEMIDSAILERINRAFKI